LETAGDDARAAQASLGVLQGARLQPAVSVQEDLHIARGVYGTGIHLRRSAGWTVK